MSPTQPSASCASERLRVSVLVILASFVVLFCVSKSAAAQTYSVIHNFAVQESYQPAAGLAIDSTGTLYGTTTYTNAGGKDGGAFKMKQHGSGWLFLPLANFPVLGNIDPRSPLLVAADGTLYGTLYYNYGCDICGGFFHLVPPGSVPRSLLQMWNSNLLHNFTGGVDGGSPSGALTVDHGGNVYGTTERGGAGGQGAIYEEEHSSGTFSVIYSPPNQNVGVDPLNGVVADSAGNLYGVFQRGGPNGPGAVYELSNSGSGWTEQTLYGFTAGSDGAEPESVIFDASGNLFGATTRGGTGNGGTIFKLTPGGGGWSLTTLYNISGTGPCGVVGRLTLDSAGNLYGVTYCDGSLGYGSIFGLTPSGGGYTYSDLHDFTNGNDGSYPNGDLVLDAQGNLYGTTFGGGSDGAGVVFELTP